MLLERTTRFAGAGPCSCGFAGAQPRLAKIAQYIAIFGLSTTAPYLLHLFPLWYTSAMIASRVQNLKPYQPGEQPKDRDYVKLNANENPYAPAPAVIDAVCDHAKNNPMALALYADPDSNELRKAIATHLNSTGGVMANCCRLPQAIRPDMVFCGNGSDEVLSFVFYAFFDSQRPLILPEHTYSFYPVYAGYYGIPLKKLPLQQDFSLDVEAMAREARDTESSLIFANPNAPSSLAVSQNQLRQFLGRLPKNRVHVVDEAYMDFASESALGLLSEFPNLVVVRTFSKSLSLAGMRLGYAVASPDLIQVLHRVKDSFNHFPVDTLAQKAGIAACSSTDYYVDCTKKIVEERNSFAGFLKDRGWQVLDSATNFIFTKKDGISGRQVYEKLKEAGVLVRRFDTPGIEEFLRITVGTREQMDRLRTVFPRV